MLKLSQPNISEAAIRAVADVLRTGQLVHGQECEAFEQELASYLQCSDAVLVSSGTAALHVALLALDIGPGDAVLVPDFTFPATANVVSMVGARVVIVDVEAGSYTLSTSQLEATIKNWSGPERLRAIMPVHEFGCPAEMDSINQLARDHGLFVIEDAACALGAEYKKRKAGTLGDIGCFSFHPRKTLTTGEGGFISTNNPALAKRMRRLRNHGMEREPHGMVFLEPATNYRLTNFQAALGRAQLPDLDGWLKRRRYLAEYYISRFHTLKEKGLISLPTLVEGHSWQTFMLVLNASADRATIIAELKKQGIESNIGAQSLSQIGIYGVSAPMPKGEKLYQSGLALPFFEKISEDDINKVVEAVESCLKQFS